VMGLSGRQGEDGDLLSLPWRAVTNVGAAVWRLTQAIFAGLSRWHNCIFSNDGNPIGFRRGDSGCVLFQAGSL
jgi:hypothetical protein